MVVRVFIKQPYCAHWWKSTFLQKFLVCFEQQNGSGIPAVLASVIINSSDLLRVDLIGVHVILPQLLSALEDLQQKFRFIAVLYRLCHLNTLSVKIVAIIVSLWVCYKCTQCFIKKNRFVFDHNSCISWSIFIVLSPLETGMNAPQYHVIFLLNCLMTS